MSATTSDTADAEPGDDESSGGGSWWTARPRLSVGGGVVLLVLGVIGFVSSATLTIERIELLINPAYVPSCSLNPVLSCGSVMVTEQARVFGFPNPLIGIAAFAVIIVTGVLATGRVSLPRWYWAGQTLFTALGFIFLNWLAFQSLYRIGALCPYCMVVWTVTPIILILSAGRLFGESFRARDARGWLWLLLPLWYAIIIVAIGIRFWSYWQTLI